MKLKNFFAVSLLCAASLTAGAKPPVDSDAKITKILNSLTLEQKAGQLSLISIDRRPNEAQLDMIREGKVGNILKSNGVEVNLRLQKIAVEESESGIPILFHEDVIHGYRTISPIPLAEAASWDMEAVERSAAMAAREMASAGVMLTYAPMVDVARDPRWGRILETSGEDTYLGAMVAAARVHGFQDNNDDPTLNVLACVKHFAGYGASLAGRDYNIQDVSEREMREIYLPTFQAAIDAGVASLMCAYTMYDGEPLTANDYMLKDVLRGEMGFKGVVMTDWLTIPNLVKIGMCADNEEATIEALSSGIDMDMTAKLFVELLPDLVREGKVSEKELDDAVRRVLELKDRIGLLDNPYAYMDAQREKKELLSDNNKAEAKDMALKSMVLLKNENATLPLDNSKVKRLAVIGPMADTRHDLLGWWSAMGRPDEVQTIGEAIKAKFSKDYEIEFAAGCIIDSFNMAGRELIVEAVEAAKRADMVIMVLGERFWMSGEGGGVASLHLPGLQEELLSEVSATGTPVATVIVSGRPYVLTDVADNSAALLEAWMPGTMGAEALCEILAGDYNPSGKLPSTFPRHEGQVPIYYNYKRTSHTFDALPGGDRYSTTYRDVLGTPLYPFGYGLSYTTFDYSPIELSHSDMTINSTIEVSVDITNSGKVKGREVVQLYIGDKICSVVRPEMELKDFAVVELEAGETKSVTFTITSDKLSFIAKDYSRKVEKGDFTVFVGRNSADLAEASFTLR